MAFMSLVGGFMPKLTFIRMPHTRLCYLQRRALIISSASGKPDVSRGSGPKINGGGKSKDAATTRKEKLPSGDSGKENKKTSEEKVQDGSTMNNKATT